MAARELNPIIFYRADQGGPTRMEADAPPPVDFGGTIERVNDDDTSIDPRFDDSAATRVPEHPDFATFVRERGTAMRRTQIVAVPDLQDDGGEGDEPTGHPATFPPSDVPEV